MNRSRLSITCSSGELVVPDDLTERDQWVLWRYEEREGRRTKVPYQAGRRRASSTDPTTWTSFESVINEWRHAPSWYTGPGFVFSASDPFCGLDLDDALDDRGNVRPWAQKIVERFSDTYMEISPSGQGLKIWARGSVPANLGGVGVGDGQIEMYDHARYFAVTGRVFRGAPQQIEDHESDLQALYARLFESKRRATNLQFLGGGQIPYGRQHNTLVSIAGTLRRRGICDEAIESCLQMINARQCERPGPAEHIARIVRSTRRWGATA